MRFVLAEIENVMGLHGAINFLNAPTLFYGKNLAGKSNIVNLIRYCFVSGKGGRTYTEKKRLNLDEMLLDQTKDGKSTFYIEHKNKLYKLEYQFKRSSKKVTQKINFFEAFDNQFSNTKIEDTIKNLEWTSIASNASQLKEKFRELEIYSDVINILMSPSNVSSFTEAINDKLVTVPEIIAKQISNLNKGTEKLSKNFQKLENVLLQQKETYETRIENLRNEFKKESSKDEKEISKTFVLGKIFQKLEEQRRLAEDESSKIPSKETEIELLKQKWAPEFKDKLQKLTNAKKIIQEREEFEEHKKHVAELTDTLDTVKEWYASFKNLPSKNNIQVLLDFEIPSKKSVDFKHFFNKDIEKIFSLLSKAKHSLKSAKEIAENYRLHLSLGEIRSLSSTYKKLQNAIKSPHDKPKGSDAVIVYSDEEKESEVHLPLDALLDNPNFLRGIKSTPYVYKNKELTEKGLRKITSEIDSKSRDLENCRKKLSLTITNLEDAKRMVPLLKDEIDYLDDKKKDSEKTLTGYHANWQSISNDLANTFHIKPIPLNLETIDEVRDFVKKLQKALEEIEQEFISDVKQKLTSAGIEVPSSVEIENITSVDDIIEKKSKELTEKREKWKKIKDWISSNLNEIKSTEDHLLTIYITETALVVLYSILNKIQEHTNLEFMSEQIAQSIEEYVKQCVEMMLPEEIITFRHVGKGNFVVETVNGEPITHPAGSHKAVISLGIMLTLSKLFDLPVILDEATDRFDYYTLKNVFQFANMISQNGEGPQICFVSYRTLNIERNPEILDIIKDWNIYMIERQGRQKEIVKVADVNQILN